HFRSFNQPERTVKAEDNRLGIWDVELERLGSGHAKGSTDDAADGVEVGDDEQVAGGAGSESFDGCPGAVADDLQRFAAGGGLVKVVHEIAVSRVVAIVRIVAKDDLLGEPFEFAVRALHQVA